MLTLTIDPSLFTGSKTAHRHVCDCSAIGRTMRELRRLGLIGPHYCWVIEFQRSGMPHWHILVESRHVPHGTLQRIWGRFRPSSAPPFVTEYNSHGKLRRPPFGFVSVTSSNHFQSAEHAVAYLLKYVSKEPESGYPAWLLHSRRNIHKSGVSKGFWAAFEQPKPRKRSNSEPQPSAMRPTVQQRLESCGSECVVRSVDHIVDDGGEITKRTRVYGRVEITRETLRVMLGLTEWEHNSVDVPRDFADHLLQRYAKRKGIIFGRPKWQGPPSDIPLLLEVNPINQETNLPEREFTQSLICFTGEGSCPA